MLIVVSMDEHLNEYVHLKTGVWKLQQKVKANPDFLVLLEQLFFVLVVFPQLFVDSRYHLQAEQTCGEYFDIQKLGMKV
ncbi:MAG: hypothetical protein CM1200mP30_23870 [Pseudomonadota bacterium]|nr:MAG: hypothetical protein CM1200mP30_23870 [Pseudomonadota bacterium]